MVRTELGAVLVGEVEVVMEAGSEVGVEGVAGDVMEVCENLCSWRRYLSVKRRCCWRVSGFSGLSLDTRMGC